MLFKRALPLLVGCLLLIGCGRAELYTKLTEAQANEMVAVLRNAGVDAEKSHAGEEGWTISAGQAQFSRAIEVLHSQGYPREEFASLGTVFKKEGFVSSPVEERARLVFGLSQELSHTVSEIDGVVQARVHLALPEAEPMAQTSKPSSASVFIKYRQGSRIDDQVGKVKALVVNSVEGLKYDNVTVVTFPAQPLPTVAPGRSAQQVMASLATVTIPLMVVALALFGYSAFRRRNLRRSVPAIRDEHA